MRYAYLKYGNVVDELRAVGPRPASVPASGPITFAGNFLRLVGNDPALMVSPGASSETLRIGSVEAVTLSPGRGIGKLPQALANAWRQFRMLMTFKPDVIVCTADGFALWTAFLVSRLKRAWLVHSRQRAIRVASDPPRRKVIAYIDGMVIRRVDRVICHGPFTRNQVEQIGVPSEKIIEFDVRFDRSEPLTSVDGRAAMREARRRITFLGRVEASKGIFELLDAFSSLAERFPDADLCYVGGGGDLERLRALVDKRNLANRVYCVGRVSHGEIWSYLERAYVLVTPTRSGLEGNPMTVLEGLAAGAPVIGPNAGPFPFMIHDEVDGLLFEVDSVRDLRRKLEAVLRDRGFTRRLSEGAVTTEREREAGVIDFGQALAQALEAKHDIGGAPMRQKGYRRRRGEVEL